MPRTTRGGPKKSGRSVLCSKGLETGTTRFSAFPLILPDTGRSRIAVSVMAEKTVHG